MYFRLPNWKYLRYDVKEWFERLALREWINNNPRIIIGITLGLVIVFIATIISQCTHGRGPAAREYRKVWFYDLNTRELFIATSDKLPPIKAPSGSLPNGEPAGVKAYVLSYSDKPNEPNHFIGYLEKFTPKGKEYMSSVLKSRDNLTEELFKQCSKERLIRRVEDEHWFTASSNEGRAIINETLRTNEKGEHPHYYLPK